MVAGLLSVARWWRGLLSVARWWRGLLSVARWWRGLLPVARWWRGLLTVARWWRGPLSVARWWRGPLPVARWWRGLLTVARWWRGPLSVARWWRGPLPVARWRVAARPGRQRLVDGEHLIDGVLVLEVAGLAFVVLAALQYRQPPLKLADRRMAAEHAVEGLAETVDVVVDVGEAPPDRLQPAPDHEGGDVVASDGRLVGRGGDGGLDGLYLGLPVGDPFGDLRRFLDEIVETVLGGLGALFDVGDPCRHVEGLAAEQGVEVAVLPAVAAHLVTALVELVGDLRERLVELLDDRRIADQAVQLIDELLQLRRQPVAFWSGPEGVPTVAAAVSRAAL